MAQKLRTRTIDAGNLFTDSCELTGYFNISISGTWTGKVTCQRSFDLGSTWLDVATWTENTQEYGFEPEWEVYYRAGVKVGEFGSGSVTVRISQ
jgi:hypothetical protein